MDNEFMTLDARAWWDPTDPLGGDFRMAEDGTVRVPAARAAEFLALGCLPVPEPEVVSPAGTSASAAESDPDESDPDESGQQPTGAQPEAPTQSAVGA